MNASAPWEVVIGLETHAQLSTSSKIFSGASTAFGAAPNRQASAVDIALPGVLPVANRGAVERAIRFGLAVGATIAPSSVFARKNYFYPDLPKGYQISQFEIPVVQGGSVPIVSPTRGEIRVRLTRAHLEEDAGKSLHEDFHGMTGIDLNRAGTPLLEIVSEPEMRSAAEAVAYARTLHALVRWIGICDGNMQEGSFRCDANVSIRKPGAPLGTRCEIKNLNSFRFLEQAIEYEVRRQSALLEDGGRVVQETRLYDPDRGETRSMRSKEDAQDYRYFPDPDLPPLVIDSGWVERVRAAMPELPEARRLRFSATSREHFIELMKGGNGVDLSELSDQVFEEGNAAVQASALRPTYALPLGDATALVASRASADYFEAVVAAGAEPKAAANWQLGDLAAALNRAERDIEDAPVTPAALAALIARVADGTLSGKIAKEVFDAMWGAGAKDAHDVDRLIDAGGKKQISDTGAIERVIDEVLAANASIVAEFRAGKEKAFNALVGKAMAATRGQANPALVNATLKRKLGG
jgi:aspartyl-tRNA(Asn)/glutamyl-tRNA(Gln) amidotransferase subunit B